MAANLEGGCRVSDMREGESLTEGTLRIWNRIGRATGAQAISLRVMEFAPGLSPGIRNDDCDEILYVLDWERGHPARDEVSTAHVSGWVNAFIDGHNYHVDTNTGIYLRPDETFAINNPGPASIVLVSSQCPDPDRRPSFVAPLTAPSADSSTPDHPPLVRLADRPAQPTADRWYRVLVDNEVGSTQVTQFVGAIPPGRAPDHFHNYEEVLFILKGEGRMWTGETNTPIAPGSCIYLPKGQVHCVENTGTDELRLLGVFYPAGSPSVRYDV
ncbi:MAG TPA: cupin domain-containing protein [Pyrinomonadaceae bacterium]|nr:cupin domain-containing protein [Pyrinomonadaceae bacterium]